MDRENVIYNYNGILFSHKKNFLPSVTTWMDLEGIMLSEIWQTEKDKYHMILLTCGIVNKTKQNTPKKTELMDTEDRLVVARGRAGWDDQKG